MSRYLELLEQQKQLAQQVEEARREESKDAAEQCRKLIELFNLSPQDVGFVRTQQIPSKKEGKGDKTFGAKAAKNTPPPLYRDPASGKTWSGRGIEPKWLQGHRDEYLIRDNETNKQAA
jgi:DNA-binding protein H-NS